MGTGQSVAGEPEDWRRQPPLPANAEGTANQGREGDLGARESARDDTVRAVFGPRLFLAQQYAELLAGPALERGLIGPREVDRLWERHLLNCGMVQGLLPEGARVVDIGSGAGLPGLVLAIARPDLRVTLVESRLRPTQFLVECVDSLQLSAVSVRRARAEDVGGSVTADVVTGRAVASLSQLMEWSLPMLPPGRELLAMKGDRAEEELAGARPALRRWGVREAEVVTVGEGVLDLTTTVVRIEAGKSNRGARPRKDRR